MKDLYEAEEDYKDDDEIAYYTVSSADNIVFDNLDDSNSSTQTIQGPRGTSVQFKIAASINLNTSTYLFTKLGSTWTMLNKNLADIKSWISNFTSNKSKYQILIFS